MIPDIIKHFTRLISSDDAGKCFICGRIWPREDSDQWVYFDGKLACKEHPGVMQWYNGALRMMRYRYNLMSKE